MKSSPLADRGRRTLGTPCNVVHVTLLTVVGTVRQKKRLVGEHLRSVHHVRVLQAKQKESFSLFQLYILTEQPILHLWAIPFGCYRKFYASCKLLVLKDGWIDSRTTNSG